MTGRDETMLQLARCEKERARIESSKARLRHECEIQWSAMRHADVRISGAAHLPLRHAPPRPWRNA